MEASDQEKYWRARGFEEGEGHAAKKFRGWFYGLTVLYGWLAFHGGYLIAESVHERDMASFYYGLIAVIAYFIVAWVARVSMLSYVEKA
ncbi:hypothetical protein [Brevundimonas naejangsanensis]|uniref:hypothetical protein n=1 Tax=Brevundimonas naejangsanensis TaxID=588932 RepID=UPI0034D4D785